MKCLMASDSKPMVFQEAERYSSYLFLEKYEIFKDNQIMHEITLGENKKILLLSANIYWVPTRCKGKSQLHTAD